MRTYPAAVDILLKDVYIMYVVMVKLRHIPPAGLHHIYISLQFSFRCAPDRETHILPIRSAPDRKRHILSIYLLAALNILIYNHFFNVFLGYF